MSVEQKRIQQQHVKETLTQVESYLRRGDTYIPVSLDYYTYYQPIDTTFLMGMYHIARTLQEEIQEESI